MKKKAASRSRALCPRHVALGVACAAVLVLSLGLSRGAFRAQSVMVGVSVVNEDDDLEDPYVEELAPSSGATLVSIGTTVSMHVKDFKNNAGILAGSGVDLASIRVTISYGATSTTYQDGDPEFSASGIAANRTIVITPAASFPYNTAIHVSVEASDLHVPANVMSTFRYSFRTETDPAPSSSSSSSPFVSDNDQGVAPGNGGRRGSRTEILLQSLDPSEFPIVIERRKLPDNTVVERVLPRRDALRFQRCYLEDTLHPSAPLTGFTDVPAGAWYEESLAALVMIGAVDDTGGEFRPAAAATRAELAKLLVAVRAASPSASSSAFDDVDVSAWYAAPVGIAAEAGWMRGDDNCHGTHPCTVRPGSAVTRAEAAAMVLRAFGYQPLGLARPFGDVAPDSWYAETAATGADHCILEGNAGQSLMVPARAVNRAELIVMLDRAMRDLRYGRDCGLSE